MKCPKYDSPIIQLKDKLLSKWKYKSTLLKLPAMGFQSVLLIRSLSNIKYYFFRYSCFSSNSVFIKRCLANLSSYLLRLFLLNKWYHLFILVSIKISVTFNCLLVTSLGAFRALPDSSKIFSEPSWLLTVLLLERKYNFCNCRNDK